MLYILGTGIMTAALLMVFFLGRAAQRPGAPGWLRRIALGNLLALTATIVLASGFSALLQAAFISSSMTGLMMAGVAAAAPFLLLWLTARLYSGGAAVTLLDDLPGATPSGGGRPRRGRTGTRLAAEAGRAGATSRRAV